MHVIVIYELVTENECGASRLRCRNNRPCGVHLPLAVVAAAAKPNTAKPTLGATVRNRFRIPRHSNTDKIIISHNYAQIYSKLRKPTSQTVPGVTLTSDRLEVTCRPRAEILSNLCVGQVKKS